MSPRLKIPHPCLPNRQAKPLSKKERGFPPYPEVAMVLQMSVPNMGVLIPLSGMERGWLEEPGVRTLQNFPHPCLPNRQAKPLSKKERGLRPYLKVAPVHPTPERHMGALLPLSVMERGWSAGPGVRTKKPEPFIPSSLLNYFAMPASYEKV